MRKNVVLAACAAVTSVSVAITAFGLPPGFKLRMSDVKQDERVQSSSPAAGQYVTNTTPRVMQPAYACGNKTNEVPHTAKGGMRQPAMGRN